MTNSGRTQRPRNSVKMKLIKNISQLDNSGFNNFRVGISCNPKANTPFFPFTYSSEDIGFSIALELPQELTKIIRSFPNQSILDLRENIISTVTSQIKEINQGALKLTKDMNYHGIDTSLAPYPEEGGSVGELMTFLGADNFGSNGTLFLTSFLTDILKVLGKEEGIRIIGFNGVMFSLLEDEYLGKCNNKNIFSIDALISYSSVCGCGLDMVPLPGNVFEEEIVSIILDHLLLLPLRVVLARFCMPPAPIKNKSLCALKSVNPSTASINREEAVSRNAIASTCRPRFWRYSTTST